ncbi:hypothetical protein [Arenicella xantha]|uniref:Secreted protein n=1 Tax=Arenicella xantha TaxID=644221 RepID=A0A395JQJ8_9GAMM|nr:hypothetical protein [Arenicella xantha]RBP51754.1 hypothetical protein DFR28_1021187 [Arenicella xantha]
MKYLAKRCVFILFSLVSQAFAVSLVSADTNNASVDSAEGYFASLNALCGAEFRGEMTFPVEGQDDFAGKVLVARFDACSADEVRVPFIVGEDRSRTWVFSRTESGLRLKHDHRHADGTADEITDYGGDSTDSGTILSQSFAADQHTIDLIPAAATNVWTVSFNTQYDELTYHLERHGKPRFTAVLSLVD